jgi:polysaccharide export outer membrane protein
MTANDNLDVSKACRIAPIVAGLLMLAGPLCFAASAPAQTPAPGAAAQQKPARSAALSPAPALPQGSVPGAVPNGAHYLLGPGDVLKITVYNNPDLSTEAQVSNAGRITFPLLGEVEVGGLDTAAVEALLAKLLSERKFVVNPQVNVLTSQYRSQQVSVLGQVTRPGKIPLDTASSLTDLLASAGGIAPTGADFVVIVSKSGDGSVRRREVDLSSMILGSDLKDNVTVANGDIIYVPRAPMFYIYGEVKNPGTYRLEREMTVMQALSVGGGLTPRGTQRGLQVHRRNGEGATQTMTPQLTDRLRENDVVFVKESLF